MPKPKIETTPKHSARSAQTPEIKRQTTLDAAIRPDHVEAMKPLLEKGIKQRDIVILAGRRTAKQFTVKPKYVPKPVAKRLPMSDGYHTTKNLPASILDALRAEHDPLGIKSDHAMVRGQFETLFWSVLEDVIKELREKYG